MLIKNAKRWAPYGARGYAVAALAFLLAFSIRYALHEWLVALLPYMTFLVAVLLVEYYYGVGPSAMLAIVSIPVGVYFFVAPFNAFDLAEVQTSDILVTVGYALVMGLGIALIESLQRSRYESRLLAEVARTRYEVLLRSESERQSAVASARKTREHFHTFTTTVGEVLYMRRVGGGFEYVSDVLAKLSGTPIELLTGGRWLSVLHPDDAISIEEQLAQVLDTRQQTLSEFRLRTAEGGYITFEGKLSTMEDARGLVVRWTGAIQEPFAGN